MAEEGTNHWYRVIIKEGRYREVRRIWDEVGHTVSRLKRIRYGTVKLTRDIKLGQNSKMAPKQLEKLVNSAGLNEEFKSQLYSAGRTTSKTSFKQTRSPIAKNSTSKTNKPSSRRQTRNRRK